MPAIDQAYVEVLPQLDRFARELDTGIGGALRDVGRDVDRATSAIVREFDAAGNEISATLREVAVTASSNFRQLDTAAGQAAEQIEREFEEAGRSSERALDVDAEFAGILRASGLAGEGVTGDFTEAARQSDAALRGIGGGDAFAPVRVSAEAAGESVQRSFTEASRQSSGALAGIGAAAGPALLGVAAAAGAGLAAITGFGLKGAAALEQTQIGFESLLGSASAADAFIKEMQSFAASTPFEFQGLADSARRLLAIGDAAGIARSEVLPALTSIGDITAVLGAPADSIDRITLAFGQMASRGKVSLEEINQISEALPGFSGVAAIAAETGLSAAETMEKISAGEISAKTGIDALLEGMQEFPGAAGAMAKQAETLAGVFSTFTDTISLTLTEAFQPIVPAVKDGLKALTPVIEESLGALAPAIGGLLEGLIPIVTEAVGALGPILGQVLRVLGGVLADLAPALGPVGDAFGALLDAVLPLVSVAGELAGALLPPLAAVLTAVATAVAPLIGLFAQLVEDALEQLRPVLPPLADALSAVAAVIGESLAAVLPSLVELFFALLGALLPILPSLVELIAAVLGILPPLTQLASLILGVVVPALSFVIGWVAKLAGIIAGALATAITFVVARMPGWWSAITSAISGAVQRAIGIIDWFSGLPARFGAWFAAARDAAVSRLNSLLAFIGTLHTRILTGLGDLGRLLFDAGKDLIQGLINGVRSAVGGAIAAAANAASSMLHAARRAIGAESPSKAFMLLGQDAAAGLRIGLQQGSGEVAAAAAELLAHIRGGGAFFEDFTFHGASALLGRVNEELSDRFFAANRGFDFGQPGTTSAVTRFLEREVTAGGGTGLPDGLPDELRAIGRGTGTAGIVIEQLIIQPERFSLRELRDELAWQQQSLYMAGVH